MGYYSEAIVKHIVTHLASEGKEEYQKFFRTALDKFGVDSPAELDSDKKREFFNYIDSGYTAKNESTSSYEKSLKKIAHDKTLKMLSKKDKETLVKIAKLMKSANEQKIDITPTLESNKFGKWLEDCASGYQDEDEETEVDTEGLDPVGKEDDDVDNDGDSDESDEYLKNRRDAVTKAIGEASGDYGWDQQFDGSMTPLNIRQDIHSALLKADIKVKKIVQMKQDKIAKDEIGFFFHVKTASGRTDVMPFYIDTKGKVNLGVSSKDWIIGSVKGSSSKMIKNLIDYKKNDLANEGLDENGILYKAGVKKYGKEGMAKILSAAGKDLGHEEIGKIKDKYEKDESVSEGRLSSKIKKAIMIAIQMSGNMTGAVDKIEKLAKGLSDDDKVAAALKMANEAKISVEPNWEGMWRFFKHMAKTNVGAWYKIQRAMGNEWTKLDKMASKKGWVAESVNEGKKIKVGQRFNANGITWEVIKVGPTSSRAKAITKNKQFDPHKIFDNKIIIKQIESVNEDSEFTMKIDSYQNALKALDKYVDVLKKLGLKKKSMAALKLLKNLQKIMFQKEVTEVSSPLVHKLTHAIGDVEDLLDATESEEANDAFSKLKPSKKALIASLKLLNKVK